MKVSDFNQNLLENNEQHESYINNRKIHDNDNNRDLKHINIVKNTFKNKSETQEKQILKFLSNSSISDDFYKCFFHYLDELDLTLNDITYLNVNYIDNEASKEKKINAIYRTNILLNLEKSNTFIINILTRLFISKKFI